MEKHKNNGNYFQLHPHMHTGSEAKNQCRTKSYKDSFFPTVLDLWNKLDNDTRNIQSLSSLIIFNCILTGTLGAVGQMRLKQVVI
jgi:hypothetical protein